MRLKKMGVQIKKMLKNKKKYKKIGGIKKIVIYLHS
jgi:hypothetical protein